MMCFPCLHILALFWLHPKIRKCCKYWTLRMELNAHCTIINKKNNPYFQGLTLQCGPPTITFAVTWKPLHIPAKSHSNWFSLNILSAQWSAEHVITHLSPFNKEVRRPMPPPMRFCFSFRRICKEKTRISAGVCSDKLRGSEEGGNEVQPQFETFDPAVYLHDPAQTAIWRFLTLIK